MKDQARPHAQAVHFDSKQIFFQSTFDGKKTGWYFTVTGSHVYGPFAYKQIAEQILEGVLKRMQEASEHNGDDNQAGPRQTGNA